jgi:ubiquitin C-terminal hydrolase
MATQNSPSSNRWRRSSREIPDLPSPTTVVGNVPKFTTPDAHAVQAARRGVANVLVRLRPQPYGFENKSPGILCYRNAVFVMLLSSSRLMGYIQNLYNARTHELIQNKKLTFKVERNTTLFHISELWKLWASCRFSPSREAGMRFTWDFLGRQGPFIPWNSFDEQEDAHEFLLWLLRRINSDFDQHKALASEKHGFMTICQLETLILRRCVACVKAGKNEKVRGPRHETEVCLNIDLGQDDSTDLHLEDLLHKISKSPGGAYYCDDHYDEWEMEKQTFRDEEALKDAQRDRFNYEDHVWQEIYRLPEALSMAIVRFKLVGDHYKKDMRQLWIPREINLPDLEDDAPKDSTRYRLSSVILHRGREKGSGHYIAFVNHYGQWYEVDDHRVRPIKWNDVNDHDKLEERALTPYLLCWEKVVTNARTIAFDRKVTKAKQQQRKVNAKLAKRRAKRSRINSDPAAYARTTAVRAYIRRARNPSANAFDNVRPIPTAPPKPVKEKLPDLPDHLTRSKAALTPEPAEEEAAEPTATPAAPPTPQVARAKAKEHNQNSAPPPPPATRSTRAQAKKDAQDAAPPPPPPTPATRTTRAKSKKDAQVTAPPPPAPSRPKRAAASKSGSGKPVVIVQSPKPATKSKEKRVAQGRVTKPAVKAGKAAAKSTGKATQDKATKASSKKTTAASKTKKSNAAQNTAKGSKAKPVTKPKEKKVAQGRVSKAAVKKAAPARTNPARATRKK